MKINLLTIKIKQAHPVIHLFIKSVLSIFSLFTAIVVTRTDTDKIPLFRKQIFEKVRYAINIYMNTYVIICT